MAMFNKEGKKCSLEEKQAEEKKELEDFEKTANNDKSAKED